MSAPIKDGGPAFPSDYIPGTATTPGMSLRDWFAGQAAVALFQDYNPNNPNRDETELLAVRCYRISDAMLAARSQ